MSSPRKTECSKPSHASPCYRNSDGGWTKIALVPKGELWVQARCDYISDAWSAFGKPQCRHIGTAKPALELPRARHPGDRLHGEEEFRTHSNGSNGERRASFQEDRGSRIAPHAAIDQPRRCDGEENGGSYVRNGVIVADADQIARAEHHCGGRSRNEREGRDQVEQGPGPRWETRGEQPRGRLRIRLVQDHALLCAPAFAGRSLAMRLLALLAFALGVAGAKVFAVQWRASLCSRVISASARALIMTDAIRIPSPARCRPRHTSDPSPTP